MWESILIDPIGALLAVLVFSGVIAHQGNSGLWTAVELFFSTVALGFGLGCGAGYGLGRLLRNRAIPDYLHGIVALGTVFIVFAIANSLVHESGLLAVTIMGIWLANMRNVPREHILNFKESLSILLISLLFLLLAARLELAALVEVLLWGFALYLVIQLLAQPFKMLLAYDRRETLSWRERALTAWIAPRGIVAAAGAPVYAEQLQAQHYPDAQLFVPLTFAVIIITVLSASFSSRPLARLLRVAETEPRGVLIIGANPLAVAIAEQLRQWKFRPLLVDDDFAQIRNARMQGIPIFYGSPVSEAADRDRSGRRWLSARPLYRSDAESGGQSALYPRIWCPRGLQPSGWQPKPEECSLAHGAPSPPAISLCSHSHGRGITAAPGKRVDGESYQTLRTIRLGGLSPAICRGGVPAAIFAARGALAAFCCRIARRSDPAQTRRPGNGPGGSATQRA